MAFSHHRSGIDRDRIDRDGRVVHLFLQVIRQVVRLGLLGAGVGGAWWFRDYVLWREPEVVLPAQGSTGWLPYAVPRAPTHSPL